jgi:TrpR-related protein YerC/YecD
VAEYQLKGQDDVAIANLIRALLALQNEEELNHFLHDLCTVSEIKVLAQRLQVAKMLTDHETYTTITDRTGASTATISRVKRFLNNGAGGYRLVLERMDETGEIR